MNTLCNTNTHVENCNPSIIAKYKTPALKHTLL